MKEKLVKEFLGDKTYKEFNRDTLNWKVAIISIILGPLWFIYRRAYLIAILYLYVTCLLASIHWIFYIVIFLAYLYGTNVIVLKWARGRVAEIIRMHPNESELKLQTIARTEGEPSVSSVIKCLVLYMVLILIGLIIKAVGFAIWTILYAPLEILKVFSTMG